MAKDPQQTGKHEQPARGNSLRQELSRLRRSSEPTYIFQTLLDNLETGVAHADLSGTILYANPRFAEILGQPVRRIIGSDLKRFIAVGGWIELARALERGTSGVTEGEMNVVSEYAAPHRVIRLLFSPIAVGARRTVEIVATEVTELVQTTKALERTEASLQSVSARLLQIQDEERRRLARDLHDSTGQELSMIIMTVDLLAKKLADSDGDRQKMAQECAQKLRKVENDIRTLSYVLHPPLLDEMGLGSALKWYLEGYAKRTGIKVECDIPANVPRFAIDKETALFRVIQECLTNVYRHSGSERVHIRLTVRPHAIEAVVEDQGKGFSQEVSARSKSGVGIQSMKGRLDMVGGGLDIESGARGTRVRATVPLEQFEVTAGEEDQQPVQKPSGEEERGRGPRRILIADDHQVARRGIRILLDGQPDLEICGEASDGLQALEKAKELDPDLVILDLSMPHMGGLTAANHIRQAGLGAKILVYTSHSYPQLEQAARAVGCDGFVIKSDASHDLIRATRTILGGGKFYKHESAQARTA